MKYIIKKQKKIKRKNRKANHAFATDLKIFLDHSSVTKKTNYFSERALKIKCHIFSIQKQFSLQRSRILENFCYHKKSLK